jgi:hypothetical protein
MRWLATARRPWLTFASCPTSMATISTQRWPEGHAPAFAIGRGTECRLGRSRGGGWSLGPRGGSPMWSIISGTFPDCCWPGAQRRSAVARPAHRFDHAAPSSMLPSSMLPSCQRRRHCRGGDSLPEPVGHRAGDGDGWRRHPGQWCDGTHVRAHDLNARRSSHGRR